MPLIRSIVTDRSTKEIYKQRASQMLNEKIDLTDYLVTFFDTLDSAQKKI